MSDPDSPSVLAKYVMDNLFAHRKFLNAIEYVFREEPSLIIHPPVVHSIKTRVKEVNHIEDKIERKRANGIDVTRDNIFDEITDIVGIRVIHLHLEQFPLIHNCIMRQVESKDWVLYEQPKAYTWDPEYKAFFENLKLTTEVKDSFYTSIHYVVKPRADSVATCEIQVRTLFEEIWGEIDHAINYPHPTTNNGVKEQIRVLARLVGAGSRLADSIFRAHKEGMRAPVLNATVAEEMKGASKIHVAQ